MTLLEPFALGEIQLRNRVALAPMTLEDFRAVFSGPLMGNCGYTPETAEAAIGRGGADLIAIGRPYITNPDLVERIRNGWPLAPDSDPGTWYAGGMAEEGYTTFSTYDAKKM